jgi:hypothetical protein
MPVKSPVIAHVMARIRSAQLAPTYGWFVPVVQEHPMIVKERGGHPTSRRLAP